MGDLWQEWVLDTPVRYVLGSILVGTFLYWTYWLFKWAVGFIPESHLKVDINLTPLLKAAAFLVGVLCLILDDGKTRGGTSGGAASVYYFYDRQGNLLYVGMTQDIRRRWAQHAEDKSWWHLVARKEYVTYSTREEAARVEAHQIRTQRPMFNRAMNGWLP